MKRQHFYIWDSFLNFSRILNKTFALHQGSHKIFILSFFLIEKSWNVLQTSRVKAVNKDI
jgi:hypothetical protein